MGGIDGGDRRVDRAVLASWAWPGELSVSSAPLPRLGPEAPPFLASRSKTLAPTDADFALLERMLTERGLGAAEIEALLDGRHPDPPIADDRLCDAGLVYYDVLKQLPEDARLRIYALSVELMSRL